jgi:hypothetical protein
VNAGAIADNATLRRPAWLDFGVGQHIALIWLSHVDFEQAAGSWLTRIFNGSGDEEGLESPQFRHTRSRSSEVNHRRGSLLQLQVLVRPE